MKKLLTLVALAAMTLSASAQGIEIQNSSNQVVASYGSGYKAVLKKTVTAKDPTKFSVSVTKQVEFSKGNLYWDGSAWHFETNQTDYQTSWNASHVSHLYWSKTASVMYAESYDDSPATDDAFFFCYDNRSNDKNKVDGASGYYALTSAEWTYLIQSRDRASSLYKKGVTVTNNGTEYTNCLIIAPDGYTGTLSASYNLADINSAGLVCLPAAGYRDGSNINVGGNNNSGSYLSATADEGDEYSMCILNFYTNNAGPHLVPNNGGSRDFGCSVRLVK